MKRFELLKVGTDCEVFLKDISGHPIPVIGLLGGDKINPRPVLDEEGYAVQEDNVMAEFNIPPRSDVTSFVTSINKMLGFLSAHFHELDFIKLDISASQLFSPEQLEHPQAKRIGCEPDFCVWTNKMNVLKNTHPLLKKMRTSGGHVHLSYLVDGQLPSTPDRLEFVKMNDLYYGVASVLLDEDTRRKELYGKPGAFRFKDYGHEYRVLSNFWLKSDALKAWVFNQAQECIKALNERGVYYQDLFSKELGKLIQQCINTNDKGLAKSLCQEFGVQLP
jgi:hypothetical protein